MQLAIILINLQCQRDVQGSHYRYLYFMQSLQNKGYFEDSYLKDYQITC